MTLLEMLKNLVLIIVHHFKNNFSILAEGQTFGINGSFGSPEQTFDISFTKSNTKFCLVFCYKADNSYLFVNRQGIFKF